MAEITSGDLTVIVLNKDEVNALVYLLESVTLYGTNDDDRALRAAYGLLDALGVEVTV